jgi:hypothetical protein
MMRDSERTTVRCLSPNDKCGIGTNNLAIVYAGDVAHDSVNNPKNWRYCPSCGENTVFQCPECLEWHEVRHLSMKPYVCPTVIDKAKEKLASTLFDPRLACIGLFVLWVIGNFVGLYQYTPTEYMPIMMITAGLTIFTTFLVMFCLEPFVNKKRKAKFAEKFPNEWSILQRLQN